MDLAVRAGLAEDEFFDRDAGVGGTAGRMGRGRVEFQLEGIQEKVSVLPEDGASGEQPETIMLADDQPVCVYLEVGNRDKGTQQEQDEGEKAGVMELVPEKQEAHADQDDQEEAEDPDLPVDIPFIDYHPGKFPYIYPYQKMIA